jgi:hypothetical protein
MLTYSPLGLTITLCLSLLVVAIATNKFSGHSNFQSSMINRSLLSHMEKKNFHYSLPDCYSEIMQKNILQFCVVHSESKSSLQMLLLGCAFKWRSKQYIQSAITSKLARHQKVNLSMAVMNDKTGQRLIKSR